MFRRPTSFRPRNSGQPVSPDRRRFGAQVPAGQFVYNKEKENLKAYERPITDYNDRLIATGYRPHSNPGYNPHEMNALLSGAGMGRIDNNNTGARPLGGGTRSGPSPSEQQAMRDYLATLNNRAGTVNRDFDSMLAKLKGIYNPSQFDQLFDPSSINQRFDTLTNATNQAHSEGSSRLTGILSELDQRGGQARNQVAGAFQRGDQELQGLGSGFAASQAAEDAGLNQVLSSFNAGSVSQSDAGVQNMINAARASTQGAGATFDAMLADRGAVYGGLNADVSSGMSRDLQGMMTKISTGLANELSANEKARFAALLQNSQAQQQAMIQLELQRMARAQQIEDEMNRTRLQAAQAGFTI
jgi:hypothetical protein